MRKNLRHIEAQALQAQKAGDFERAAQLWRRLLEIVPAWENAYPHYHLADCYTRLGQMDKAEDAYRAAIQLAPEDDLFSVGLQSFLEARKSGLL